MVEHQDDNRAELLDDVRGALETFREMTVYISEGDMAKVASMASWMAQMCRALVRWGVVTEAEMDELLGVRAAMALVRIMQRVDGLDADNEDTDDPHESAKQMLTRFGL